MTVQSFRELIAWQKAMDLAVSVYKDTARYPRQEVYGLTSQTRRAAVSIPSNIAEGHARQSTKEFLHFLSIADGSLAEVETQVLLAERLGFLSSQSSDSLVAQIKEIGRIINGLSRSLQKSLGS
jgi:four helix bundle protein